MRKVIVPPELEHIEMEFRDGVWQKKITAEEYFGGQSGWAALVLGLGEIKHDPPSEATKINTSTVQERYPLEAEETKRSSKAERFWTIFWWGAGLFLLFACLFEVTSIYLGVAGTCKPLIEGKLWFCF